MSMVEELKRAVAASNDIEDTRQDCDVARFLRDHGQALVEALETQESDRASLVSLIAEASVARLALAHCAENSEMYQSAYDRVSKAIDLARGRTKASAGVGA